MKKKILFLLYENEIGHTLTVAKHLKKKYQPIFFSCDYLSSYAKKNVAKEALSEFGFLKNDFFDIREEILELHKLKPNNELNTNLFFLKNFEQKYLEENLNEIILKDFSFNQIYNPRDYVYAPSNQKILYKKIELLIKKIILIFKTHNIEFIYSGGRSNFIRNIILQISKKKKLSFYGPSFRFGVTFLDNYSKRDLVKILKRKNIKENKSALRFFLSKFKSNKKFILKNNYTLNLFFKDLLYFLLKQFNFINDYRAERSLRINKSKKNYYFVKSVFFTNYFLIRNTFRKLKLQFFLNKKNNDVLKYLKTNKFIFYPMHFLPEGGVFDHKELFDEFYLVQKISKNLPVDIKIIVKPHPDIFKKGTEIMPLDYYRAFFKIPNVQMVLPSVNSHYLIKKSIGVISVSSSVALEAIIFKKNSLNIAENEFANLKSIKKINYKKITTDLISNKKFEYDLKIINKLFDYGIEEDIDKFIFQDIKKFKKYEYDRLIKKYLKRLLVK